MVINYECEAPFTDGAFNDSAENIIKEILDKAEKVLPSLDCGQEVFVFVTTDDEIKKLNKEQRNIDKATDVLSFPMLNHKDGEGDIDEADIDPETDCVFLGDIVISKDHCEAQAKEYGHGVKRELAFLALHGYLHLRGFDHIEPEDEKVMQETAKSILEGIAERE